MGRLGFSDLKAAVVDRELCTACGSCEVSCPLDILDVGFDSQITDMEDCVDCEICLENCHRFDWEEDTALTRLEGEETDAGVVNNRYYGKATSERIEKVSQNGGVVSALLKSLLECGDVDAAVTVFESDEDPWKSEARVVTDFDGVIESAGSKYTVDGILKRIPEAAEHGRVALVALPCQAQSLAISREGRFRKMWRDHVGPVITIFCMEAFIYDELQDFCVEHFDSELTELEKMAIADGEFQVWRDGEKMGVDVGKCDDITREACKSCHDLTGEYSDISVGNIGSPDGHSTILTRSELGEEVYRDAVERGDLEGAPLEETNPGFGLVEKLTNYKIKKNS